MRVMAWAIGVCVAVASVVWVSAQQARPAAAAVLYEGARLITGDGRSPLENSAFLVENGAFTRVGRKGEVPTPAGSARVDLAGKTVIPGLVDVHNHLGWTDHKTNRASKTTYTRELVVDHLQRYAYYGVVAAMSLGLDRWDANLDMPYQLRDELLPNAARFLTAGRGIAATPLAGPTFDYRVGVPYGAMTEAEGRAVVQALRARKVEMVKIWVDDRQGAVPKLQVDVVAAIVDEAHKNGMRVVSHIFNLADGKQLLKSGIDGFAHGVRDRDVDDEYIALLKQHPKVWIGPNLPPRALTTAEREAEIALLAETFPATQIKRMRDQLASRTGRGGGASTQSELFSVQCRNLKRVHDAGAIIGLGTDGAADIGWSAHTELADMVACGLTPAEAIVAGTRTSAEILKLDRLGMVAVGKSADFVVLHANPLDDILNTRRIDRVFMRGTVVDRAALSRSFTAEATN